MRNKDLKWYWLKNTVIVNDWLNNWLNTLLLFQSGVQTNLNQH